MSTSPSAPAQVTARRWLPISRCRVENLLLGGTILFWTLADVREPIVLASPVRVSVLALNVCVGLLITLRSQAQHPANWSMAAVALPSVTMGFLACYLAPDPQTWRVLPQAMFVVGCSIAIGSFLTLGRSFAVLPSVRGVVTSGPYRFVRHPAYSGELLLAAACFVAGPSWLTSLPILLVVPLTMVRLHAEERLLGRTPEYAAYQQDVRWRLVPGLW